MAKRTISLSRCFFAWVIVELVVYTFLSMASLTVNPLNWALPVQVIFAMASYVFMRALIAIFKNIERVNTFEDNEKDFNL